MPLLSRRGRLPLLTGLCGLVWNVGALVSFGIEVASRVQPDPIVVAIAFGALGFLPAVVVHSLLEGPETDAGPRVVRPAIGGAYALSSIAAAMHGALALQGHLGPSRPALWVLTGGFSTLTLFLLVVTRQQPLGRRGVWVAVLSVFAVSALHFGRHTGGEVWWVELVGHHASLLLVLAILHQDYRFALADLFLKNAISLLLLMGLSLALFSGVLVPLMAWRDTRGVWSPNAIALVVAAWMTTALVFPWLRVLAARLVDRAVLRRPDYEETLSSFARTLDAVPTEDEARAAFSVAIRLALGVTELRVIDDSWPDDDRRLVLTGPGLRESPAEAAPSLVVRLRTVEPPHVAIALGALGAGRRLLSGDLHLVEWMARLSARRVDALRVGQERAERDVREQRMQRLATEAELRALRAQLNPHFLFNALTTVGYLIQTAPPRALETLLRLTTVLRSVLQRSSADFSTLGEEIDLVASYLEIEHARFEERLEVNVSVPAGLRDCLIPTLILQPLVENAVKHGLAARVSGGTIHISAQASGSDLRIAVDDSGVGFDPASARARAGIGLRNVADRLRVHYGDLARLDITSAPNRGTQIRLSLPARHGAARVARGA
jgi:two-component system LytT family sensor kinase